eukprot:COSAG06_NODE_6330_length_2981_cov_17.637752_1_plen_913_part_10
MKAATEEAASLQAQATDDIHRLEEEAAKFKADLEHAQADAATSKAHADEVIAAKKKAESEALKAQQLADKATASAQSDVKAATDAAKKAQVDAKQKAAAAERAQAQEVEKRKNVEANVQQLEKQIAAIRSGDQKVLVEHDKTLTNQLAVAVEKARAVKAQADVDVHRLQDEVDHLKTDLEHAKEDAVLSKAQLEAATAAKLKAEEATSEMKHTVTKAAQDSAAEKKKATVAASKAAREGQGGKGMERLQKRVSDLTSELAATKDELASVKAAAHDHEVELNSRLADNAGGLGDELEQARAEVRELKAKAADDAHRLEEQVAKLELDLKHSVEDTTALNARTEQAIAAKTKAETEADALRRKLDLSTKSALQEAKEAKAAITKAELQLQKTVAAAERKLSAEQSRRENAEVQVLQLETQMVTARSGNDAAATKHEESVTSKLAEKTEEARKSTARVLEIEHLLEENERSYRTELEHAKEDAAAAKEALERSDAAKAKAEAKVTELQQAAENAGQSAAAAAKQKKDAVAMRDLETKQRAETTKRLQERIDSLTEELKAEKQDLSILKMQSMVAGASHRHKLTSATKPLKEELRQVKESMKKQKVKGTEDMHRLQDENAHLKTDLEHLNEDVTAAKGQAQALTLAKTKAEEEVVQLRQELTAKSKSTQKALDAAKEAASKAEVEVRKQAAAAKREQQEEAAKQKLLEAHVSDLEEELTNVRAADGDAMAKTEKSLSSKAKKATEDARKWEAKAVETAHRLDEQKQEMQTAIDKAESDAQAAKAEATELMAAKTKLEEECAQLQKARDALKAAEAKHTKKSDDASAKKKLHEQQSAETSSRLQAQLAELQVELKHQSEELASAESAHQKTKDALASEIAKNGLLSTAPVDAKALEQAKIKALDEAHRLQDEVGRLKI